MPRARRRKRVKAREDLEDGGSQCRINFRSNSCIHTNNKQIQVQGTSGGSMYKTLQETNYARNSSCSDSEGEYSGFSRNFGIGRHFSDFETGESSDMTFMRTRGGSKKNSHIKCDPISSQQHLDVDSSDDDSVFGPRVIKNIKRPLSPTSSSDTDDSGIPIAPKRFAKRMRLFSSSEGSSSETLSDDDHNLKPALSNGLQTNNPDQGNLGGNDTIPSSSRSSGMRSTTIESESDGDMMLPNPTIRGRRVPVIESEDDTDFPEYNSTSPLIEAANQRLGSVSSVHDFSRGSRTLSPQEIEDGPTMTVNSTDSRSYNFRIRQRRGNVWRVTSQEDEIENNILAIVNHRRVRGRRLPVIESGDSSESENDNVSLLLNPGREIGVVNDAESETLDRRINSELGNDQIHTMTNFYEGRGNFPSIQSEDESSSSDSDIRPRTLSSRMAPILQSDDSSTSSSSSTESDSDDSIPIRNSRQRRRPIPIIDDYEDIANTGGVDINIKVSSDVKVFADANIKRENSSETDEETEKCSICFSGFKSQEIGKPKSCDHKFCSQCIKEWATKSNTCPVDRKVFESIVVYNNIEGKVISEIPVEKAVQQNDSGEFEFMFFAGMIDLSDEETSLYFENSDDDGPEECCTVCLSSSRPHRMISCDGCSDVYHLGCLNPPLRTFPINWYCPSCENETDSDVDFLNIV